MMTTCHPYPQYNGTAMMFSCQYAMLQKMIMITRELFKALGKSLLLNMKKGHSFDIWLLKAVRIFIYNCLFFSVFSLSITIFKVLIFFNISSKILSINPSANVYMYLNTGIHHKSLVNLLM